MFPGRNLTFCSTVQTETDKNGEAVVSGIILEEPVGNFYDMKRLLIVFSSILLAVFPLAAQRKAAFDPDFTRNSVRAEYGALIPVGTVSNSGSGLMSLSYTRRFSGPWGWRTGVQYAPVDTDVHDFAGLPVAVVFGPFANSLDKTPRSNTGDYEPYPGRFKRETVADILSLFLRRTEVFAGITPGYLFGDATGRSRGRAGITSSTGQTQWMETSIQLGNRFSLSADAGVTLSIPLGRFSLDITPAAHCLLTDNFKECWQIVDMNNHSVGQPEVKPVRWQFSVSGGLSYRF